VKAGSEGGAGRRNRAALRNTISQNNRSRAVRDRRKRTSAFSEEIMGDITGLFNAGPEISLFEKQPVSFISDLHEFYDEFDDTDTIMELTGKEIAGYETPPHKELMNQLPLFPEMMASGLLASVETAPPTPVAHAAAIVSTVDGRSAPISIPPGATSAEATRTLAAAFGLNTSSFVLRDSTGCVVPTSEASLGGQFTLEIPSAAAGTPEPSSSTLKFLQEPPHSAAVWLHTKLTKKGEIAGACSRHVFSPAPKVGISSEVSKGSTSADKREALLSQATVTLVNAAGEEAVDKNGQPVMHTGTPVISTDPETNECTITWPEMAVLDTSRTVHGMPAEELKVSAQECGGYRGAVGWFSLRVSVPGCADLWLKNSVTGQRAKIIVKNERNAALGWAEKAEGPYADHSRCVPSHIDKDGNRLCRHGCGGGMVCGHGRSQIKTEP
jgi:hypothetical protein